MTSIYIPLPTPSWRASATTPAAPSGSTWTPWPLRRSCLWASTTSPTLQTCRRTGRARTRSRRLRATSCCRWSGASGGWGGGRRVCGVPALQRRAAWVDCCHTCGAQENTGCAVHAWVGALRALMAEGVSQAGCCSLLPLAGWRWRATAFCTSRCVHACLDRQQGSRHP